MNIDLLASVIKDCPDKSLTIQYDKSSGRYIFVVDGDDEDEQEITRSRDFVAGLQVAVEALTSEKEPG